MFQGIALYGNDVGSQPGSQASQLMAQAADVSRMGGDSLKGGYGIGSQLHRIFHFAVKISVIGVRDRRPCPGQRAALP